MSLIIKSIVYLAAFGGAGYVLMQLTEPSAEKKKLIAQSGYRDPAVNEERRKKALFLQKLQEATSDKPVYLKSQQSSEAPKQPSKREIN